MNSSPPQRSTKSISAEPWPSPSCSQRHKTQPTVRFSPSHFSDFSYKYNQHLNCARRDEEKRKVWASLCGHSGVISIPRQGQIRRCKMSPCLCPIIKGYKYTISTWSSVRAFISPSVSSACLSSSNCLISVTLSFTYFKSKPFHSHPISWNLGNSLFCPYTFQ